MGMEYASFSPGRGSPLPGIVLCPARGLDPLGCLLAGMAGDRCPRPLGINPMVKWGLAVPAGESSHHLVWLVELPLPGIALCPTRGLSPFGRPLAGTAEDRCPSPLGVSLGEGL
jgi:hypothetical protein